MTKKLFFIIILFYSSSLFSETICEVKDIKECEVTDKGEIFCSKEEDVFGLQNADPKIKIIYIYSHEEGYKKSSIPFKDFDGFITISYQDDYYINKDFGFKFKDVADKIFILHEVQYGGYSSTVEKIFSIEGYDNKKFFLTELFYLKNKLKTRISSGRCNE